MTLAFTLLFCVGSTLGSTAQQTQYVSAKPDSLPDRSVYRFGPALFTRKRTQTLIVRPNKNQQANEIGLPVGADARTLQLRMADRLLKAGDDYLFIANLNTIRIVNRGLLAGEHPLIITYENGLLAQ